MVAEGIGVILILSVYIAYGMACYTGQRQRFRAALTTGSRNTHRDSLPEIGRYAIRSWNWQANVTASKNCVRG
jgi:hypothetical protein